MKLLISVTDEKETLDALKGSQDVIIDIKNPREGSMGANFPYVITKIKKCVPKDVDISAAIGDVPNMPGMASMAGLGAAVCGVNYVKVGLKGPKTKEEALHLVKNVVKSVKEFDKSVKVVVAGYGDYKRAKTLDPMIIPEVAYEAGADVAMLDTAIKDGKKLFDFLEFSYLKSFVEKTHEKNLIAALAGSLGKEDIEKIYKTGVDVFGVRGAVCGSSNREGKLESELVRNLARQISKMKN